MDALHCLRPCAEWIAPAFVDPDGVELSRDGTDVLVSGNVHLRQGSLAGRVGALRLDAGGEAITLYPEPDPSAETAGNALATELDRVRHFRTHP